ncbi:CoA-binding protein [Gordoniibacillus kamchatkensis]
MAFENPSRERIKQILEGAGNIAVVGLSDNPERTSHMVAQAMQQRGYRIIPVNPNADTILGEKSYASISDIPEPVDIVNVFRRSEHTPEVAEEAVRIGARCCGCSSALRTTMLRKLLAPAGWRSLWTAASKLRTPLPVRIEADRICKLSQYGSIGTQNRPSSCFFGMMMGDFFSYFSYDSGS